MKGRGIFCVGLLRMGGRLVGLSGVVGGVVLEDEYGVNEERLDV